MHHRSRRVPARSRDQLERHGGHHTQSAGRPVELRNLAVGEKPAPRLLEFAHERNSSVCEIAVRCDHTAIGAHRTEGDGEPPGGVRPALGHDGDVVGGGGAVVGGGGGGGGGAAVVGGAVGGVVGAGAGAVGAGAAVGGAVATGAGDGAAGAGTAGADAAGAGAGAGAAPPRGIGAGADGATGATVGAPATAGGAGTVVVVAAGSTTVSGDVGVVVVVVLVVRSIVESTVPSGIVAVLPVAGSSSGGWGASSLGAAVSGPMTGTSARNPAAAATVTPIRARPAGYDRRRPER